MQELKAVYQDRMFLGCIAHATVLFLKDISKTQRKRKGAGPCLGTSAVFKKALMAFDVINGSNSACSALASCKLTQVI